MMLRLLSWICNKTYDHVKWVFLERMMGKLGLLASWINRVMNCISTFSYKFIVTGEVCGTVFPSRGLRQMDSLSPYLFLLCVEGLSCLFNNAEKRGKLSGFRCRRASLVITHFFSTDDGLLFTKSQGL